MPILKTILHTYKYWHWCSAKVILSNIGKLLIDIIVSFWYGIKTPNWLRLNDEWIIINNFVIQKSIYKQKLYQFFFESLLPELMKHHISVIFVGIMCEVKKGNTSVGNFCVVKNSNRRNPCHQNIWQVWNFVSIGIEYMSITCFQYFKCSQLLTPNSVFRLVRCS